ncbi:hypothetical protein QT971_20055 [Microcoleus sp. herbarium19]|uniref:hypothetical protein n=1 Tax=unclassified Microcoleus TaxID=2642155 RepID=UPI002FD0BEBA
MNSQKYKIQALIAEIDEVLSKPAPRLPWTGSIDTVHQRQLLERVRAYLASFDSKAAASKGPAIPNVRPQPVPVPKVPLPAPRPSAADQIMLAVTGEINHLRSSLTEPLQQDIEALRQQQQALIEEIKQLEAKRQQQQSLAQQQANQQQIISEFLQVLTARLEETLARDFSQILGSPENQLLLLGAAPYSLGSPRESQQQALEVTLDRQTSPEQPLLTPAQRLEQIQSFQARADSLVRRLDATVDTVFDALQANLENHQASLSQGIENMYGLSQQSEAMFAAFVNHLAEQLGREASDWVPQPIAIANLESAASPSSKQAIDSSATAYRSGGFPEQDRLPYAGTEISPQFGQLRRDRDLRQDGPVSLPDLADNLSGYASERPGSQTQFPGDRSEDMLAETGANVEDLYASLFAGESVAELELELEEFTIENTEDTVEFEGKRTVNQAELEKTETLNTAEELFVNLLDEGESLEDILVGEDSDFIIGNSADELTLDTVDLFQPQVAAVPQVSEPQQQPIARQSIEADDRPNLETTQNRAEDAGTPDAEIPQQQPPQAVSAAEISSNRRGAAARVPSAADVRTGDFDTPSQRLDDAYIQASPDEDLLPVEVLEDDLDRALNLDNNTLEQLETDLYNLEGLSNTGTGRSNFSAANSLDLPASFGEETQNPFGEDAEEEPGTLEDLFSDVLGLSSEDEPFVLEDEFDGDLFAGEDESKLTLDEILADLTETATAAATADEVRSSPAESKKKT